VLAVADATVVTAVDEFADQIPEAERPVTIEEADGNHVILKLGDRRFAFCAHLKPGTVSVKRGERVRAGQMIAETGNSGSSTGPHLHFQVMDRPSALASNGVAYVFDRFGLDGRSPPLDELLTIDPASTPVPIDRSGAGPRHDELPLGRDLFTFGTSRRYAGLL
jgi:murein DD-endopeptidase MepM/ murein hydrolase activator NlpD